MLVRIHQWLGVAIAAWLAIACVSGVLLLWKDEYYGWRYPALPDAPAVFEPSPEVIGQVFANAPESVSALGMPKQSLPAYHAYLSDGSEALFHPESAELVALWNTFDAIPAFLFELHVHLFLGEFGHNLVGMLGILILLNLSFGFVLWLRKKGVFLLRFLLPKDLSRPRLIRGHAAQGSLLSAAFLVLLFSGAAMVFAQPVQAAFNAVFGAADTLRPSVQSVESRTVEVSWPAVVANTTSVFPEADIRFLSKPQKPGDPVVARLRNSGELHPNGRSYAVLHPASGAVLETIDAKQSGLGPSLFDSLYPLHAGKTGWPGYRLLLAVLSMSLLFIALSGLYLFVTRPGHR
ncbi:MAG: PepSY-associated TM helix domain-containing protein [Pseudomonadota bacterium]